MAQVIRGWRHVGEGQWVKDNARISYQSATERKHKDGQEGWVLRQGSRETVHASRDAAMDAAG